MAKCNILGKVNIQTMVVIGPFSNLLWGNPSTFVGAPCGCVVEFLYIQIIGYYCSTVSYQQWYCISCATTNGILPCDTWVASHLRVATHLLGQKKSKIFRLLTAMMFSAESLLRASINFQMPLNSFIIQRF